jgi:hypothetical protein
MGCSDDVTDFHKDRGRTTFLSKNLVLQLLPGAGGFIDKEGCLVAKSSLTTLYRSLCTE